MKDLINCENKPMYLNISENIIANPKIGYIISDNAKDKILAIKKEELKQLIFKAEAISNKYNISFLI
ncbi:hypothetical protein [Staphylococcus epidermidis]|uniref:hypothetical protein n=1 Tax=Staphylococcus epidermidis TaxID=1282 RepID=UPI0024AE4BCB|nr:hypothetical protein [Staphylococcus epidermidis]WHI63854.1 hypothetical protein PYH64_11985 [Staphylococcus epidermidis]